MTISQCSIFFSVYHMPSRYVDTYTWPMRGPKVKIKNTKEVTSVMYKAVVLYCCFYLWLVPWGVGHWMGVRTAMLPKVLILSTYVQQYVSMYICTKPQLIEMPSLALSPVAPVLLSLSDPARSTKWNLAFNVSQSSAISLSESIPSPNSYIIVMSMSVRKVQGVLPQGVLVYWHRCKVYWCKVYWYK